MTKEKAQGEKSSNICTVGEILGKNTSEVWLITMDVWLSQLTVTFSWWLISYKNYNCPTCSGCMLCLMTSFGLQILNEQFSKEYADEPERVGEVKTTFWRSSLALVNPTWDCFISSLSGQMLCYLMNITIRLSYNQRHEFCHLALIDNIYIREVFGGREQNQNYFHGIRRMNGTLSAYCV